MVSSGGDAPRPPGGVVNRAQTPVPNQLIAVQGDNNDGSDMATSSTDSTYSASESSLIESTDTFLSSEGLLTSLPSISWTSISDATGASMQSTMPDSDIDSNRSSTVYEKVSLSLSELLAIRTSSLSSDSLPMEESQSSEQESGENQPIVDATSSANSLTSSILAAGACPSGLVVLSSLRNVSELPNSERLQAWLSIDQFVDEFGGLLNEAEISDPNLPSSNSLSDEGLGMSSIVRWLEDCGRNNAQPTSETNFCSNATGCLDGESADALSEITAISTASDEVAKQNDDDNNNIETAQSLSWDVKIGRAVGYDRADALSEVTAISTLGDENQSDYNNNVETARSLSPVL